MKSRKIKGVEMADKDSIGFLSDNTRKIRKGLLIVCLVSFSISKVGLIVKKISIMGSELAITNFESIPLILGLMVFYFLLTFICYSFEEYSFGYRKIRNEYLEKIESGKAYSLHEIEKEIEFSESEIERFESDFEVHQDSITRGRIKKQKSELEKLFRLRGFFRFKKGSFFERFRFRYLRTFMELFAPIAVGIYTLILLFFFTPVPQLAEDIVELEKEPKTKTMQIDKKQKTPTPLNKRNKEETLKK